MLLNKTILLVEDEQDLLEFTEEALIDLGCQVVPAGNAQQASNILNDDIHLDALLSDIRLPGDTDGIELAKLAQKQRPGMRILLTSGYDEYFLKKTVSDTFPVLEKPYRLADLSSALWDILGNK